MSRLKVTVGELGLILVFGMCASVLFGLWQDSVIAGFFLAALILVGIMAGLESN